MVRDLVEPIGLTRLRDQAEHTATFGGVTDSLGRLVIEAVVDETGQRPMLADHAQRSVARTGELHSRRHRHIEQGIEIGLTGYGRGTVDECSQSRRAEGFECHAGRAYRDRCRAVWPSSFVTEKRYGCAMAKKEDRALRVLLVDDHEVVRTGLKALLDAQDDITVVGEAGTAKDAVRRVGYDAPDLVVMDVRLPDGSGVDACRTIRTRWPDVSVLILTSFADQEALMSAILAGASGYVLKRVDTDGIVESVRRAGRGESLLDPDMTERLFAKLRGGSSEDPLIAKLSPQERRILALVAEGKTNRQIAEELFLAEKTVKNYVSNLLAKMGMSRRSEAAAYAARASARTEHEYPPEDWE